MAENPICGMYQRMTAEGSGNMEIIFINKVHMQMEMKQYAPNDNIQVCFVRCFHVEKKKKDVREFGDSVTQK